jgi:two-component system, chemotaxis family, chemotaxis protein CheY
MFGASAVEILTRIERAAEQSDFSAAGNGAHELKSMAKTFGLKRIGALADVIEEACLKSDISATTQAAAQLSEFLRHDLSLLLDEQIGAPPSPDISSVKPVRSRSAEIPQSLATLSILLVDDDAFSRTLASGTLRDMKIGTVVTAGSGAEALKLIQEPWRHFDLIISDWNMPEMSGLELLKKVRETWFDMPFIMLTGKTSADFILAAKEFGVNGYIAKPFAPAQLTSKIAAVLKLKHP